MSKYVVQRVVRESAGKRFVLAFNARWNLSTSCTARIGRTVRVRQAKADIADILDWDLDYTALVPIGIAHRHCP